MAVPGLLGVQREAGNRAAGVLVSRQTAAEISKEMDTFACEYLGMTGDLEDLWNKKGRDLPAAVNDPVFRDLWFKSVNSRKMDIDNASRSLRGVFEADTKNATRDLASAKKRSLEDLARGLAAAAKENRSRPPEPTGVEDHDKAMSRVAGERRLNVRDLIDTATLVDFLRNWDELLRSVPVGSRKPDTFQPFGQQPTPPPAAGDPFGLMAGPRGPGPILFDPRESREKLLQRGGEVVIDETRLAVIGKVYAECAANERDFRQLADALINEDANLAALAQAPDPTLLRRVSGLRGSSDAEAGSVITRVTRENIKHLDDLLGKLPTLDWKALRVTHDLLLSGAYSGPSGVSWQNLTEKTFIEGYFKRKAEAERAAAERRMYGELVLGGLSLIALLSPAAPLAAAVLATADVYGAATAVGAIGESRRADKRADDLGAAAGAGFGDPEEAKRARKEADDRKAGLAMDLLMAALPFVPGAAKGVKTLHSEGRFTAFADEAMAMARALHKDQRGAVRIDVLLTGGLSAAVGVPARREQVLDHMVGMIKAETRRTRPVLVAPALAARPGAERLLHAGSYYGLPDYQRCHLIGPGVGFDEYPILLGPGTANAFTNNHIEGFMRGHRKSGSIVDYTVLYSGYTGEELRPWLRSLLGKADPEIIARLQHDNLRIEPFLKVATYDINITDVAGRTRLYRANITIGLPGSGQVTLLKPTLVP
ncbi:hypothetical protein GCM10023194_37940 [Planotetraspora phitsanulokensis]|uniref:Uncharacterized protein n=2 Tax=Planotetraspora phitsanulokensis TaxID=575192 RepID=A0A8J3U9S1_9ACTN|nr:hypothetical protein Pph01_62460 [Planotetraspora phitsanulokensis]